MSTALCTARKMTPASTAPPTDGAKDGLRKVPIRIQIPQMGRKQK